MKRRWEVICPNCCEALAPTKKEYSLEELQEDHVQFDYDNAGNPVKILLFCENCLTLYIRGDIIPVL